MKIIFFQTNLNEVKLLIHSVPKVFVPTETIISLPGDTIEENY